jgi:valyl-tRNA synthetase
MTDPAPQADDQTRNQVVDPAAKDAQDAPKVKSEKECMSLESRLWMI